jgi:hypothetical protein
MTTGSVLAQVGTSSRVERADLFQVTMEIIRQWNVWVGAQKCWKTMEHLGRGIECVFILLYCVYSRVESPPAFHLCL